MDRRPPRGQTGRSRSPFGSPEAGPPWPPAGRHPARPAQPFWKLLESVRMLSMGRPRSHRLEGTLPAALSEAARPSAGGRLHTPGRGPHWKQPPRCAGCGEGRCRVPAPPPHPPPPLCVQVPHTNCHQQSPGFPLPRPSSQTRGPGSQGPVSAKPRPRHTSPVASSATGPRPPAFASLGMRGRGRGGCQEGTATTASISGLPAPRSRLGWPLCTPALPRDALTDRGPRLLFPPCFRAG